jgi:hypothetical protein
VQRASFASGGDVPESTPNVMVGALTICASAPNMGSTGWDRSGVMLALCEPGREPAGWIVTTEQVELDGEEPRLGSAGTAVGGGGSISGDEPAEAPRTRQTTIRAGGRLDKIPRRPVQARLAEIALSACAALSLPGLAATVTNRELRGRSVDGRGMVTARYIRARIRVRLTPLGTEQSAGSPRVQQLWSMRVGIEDSQW